MKIMEMICYNVKMWIVLSALCTTTYALHMVRDSYHRPLTSQAQAQSDYHHHSTNKNDGHQPQQQQQRLMTAENEPSSSSSLSVADGTILFHSAAIPNKLSPSKYTDYNMFNNHNIHHHNNNYNQNIDADENDLRKVDGLNQHIPPGSLTSKMQLQHLPPPPPPPSHHYKLTKSPVSIPMFDTPSTSLDIRFKSDNIYDGQPARAHTVLLNQQHEQNQELANHHHQQQQQQLQQDRDHQLSNSLMPQEEQHHHQQQQPEHHLKEPQVLEKLFQKQSDEKQHRQLDSKQQKLPLISHQKHQPPTQQQQQQQKRASTLNRYYGHPYTEYDDNDEFDDNAMGNVINSGGNNNRDHSDDVDIVNDDDDDDADDDVEIDGIGGLMDRSDVDTKSFQSSLTHDMVNQHMYRNNRGQRQYDVPQVECPPAVDGMERFACPKPDRTGRYRCIDDHVLCDGFLDCPMGEDEDRMACMFYKTTKAHLDVLADALLRWARGR